LSVDKLFGLVPPVDATRAGFCGLVGDPCQAGGDCCTGECARRTCTAKFEDQFRGVDMNRVRVFQFGGDMVVVPTATAGEARIFMASRGKNRLTMVVAKSDGTLDCSTERRETISAIDCTDGYVVRTEFDDPFALAFAPSGSPLGVIAVGHLRAQQSGDGFITSIGLAQVSTFVERIQAEERGGALPLTSPLEPMSIANVAGVTGVAFVPGSILGGSACRGSATPEPPCLGTFLAAGRQATTGFGVALSGFDLAEAENRPVLRSGPSLAIGAVAQATEMRGLVLSKDAASSSPNPENARAYVSARFLGTGNVFNSGIAVVAIEERSLRLISIYEAGEELGRPFLLERPSAKGPPSRLLYVPDIRTDSIVVLDASTDQLTFAGSISGRAFRNAGGKTVLARTLDAPASIAFVERQGRTLGFVANFGNSTLGVIDASDPDPKRHRVVARIGCIRNADDTEEQEVVECLQP
jgi:hypothetical protein